MRKVGKALAAVRLALWVIGQVLVALLLVPWMMAAAAWIDFKQGRARV